MTFYHGGIAGKRPGDYLFPSPPHVEDGCPICVARAAGRTLSVGEYRRWLSAHGEDALPILRALAGADDVPERLEDGVDSDLHGGLDLHGPPPQPFGDGELQLLRAVDGGDGAVGSKAQVIIHRASS